MIYKSCLIFLFYRYTLYWRNRFKTVPIDEIIPAIHMSQLNNKYFLISPLIKEDKKLRHKLKLENALKVQESERIDKNFKRSCLFCKLEFEGEKLLRVNIKMFK